MMTQGKTPTLVIADKAGRLGNRLFLSAYFMANALAREYHLCNPALGEYAEFFAGSARDPLCRFPVIEAFADIDVASQIRELTFQVVRAIGSLAGSFVLPGADVLDIRGSHDAPDKEFDLNGEFFAQRLQTTPFLLVKGWKFRDDQNLVRFHREIAAYFTPVDEVRFPAERVIAQARKRGDLVIGVHIRQGDYRGWKNGAHYFETSQYAHWMREASELFPDKKTVFIACASDPLERSVFSGFDYVDGPGNVISDLHTLSLCDRIMGPPSTFSTWASYHGRVPLCMLQHHLQKVTAADFVLHDKV
jgi:hypothetical protein